MMRWLEEYELKHVEFTRCIRSFKKMSIVWEELASKDERPGYASYARQQAHRYTRLRDEARSLFGEQGNPAFVDPKPTLIEAFKAFRSNELSWLRELAQVE